MLWWELQNIKKFKTNKARKVSETAIMSLLNKFLLNMLSDQIKFSMNFDLLFWFKNMSFKDTSQ